MGHLDGSAQARYSHITQAMREQLMEALTGLWYTAPDGTSWPPDLKIFSQNRS
ncbi:hypothetical protein GCM10009661_57930 [Catellatospora chokoriensis]|uniref:Uncharacterized protein n=1 Tax=Catellatospora chokoriensis TaxID=310353 RepID=A0A8J3NX03_9ACTN|nr:hypothetical protein Cch02nite_72440 [Catellatospora chokoriensis]